MLTHISTTNRIKKKKKNCPFFLTIKMNTEGISGSASGLKDRSFNHLSISTFILPFYKLLLKPYSDNSLHLDLTPNASQVRLNLVVASLQLYPSYLL